MPPLPLYDVHTHVGLDLGFHLRGWWPYAATARDLLNLMDQNSIERAICFPFTLPSAFHPYAFADNGEVRLLPDRVPFDRENDLLAREIDSIDTQKRLIQFAMFDPSRKVTEQVRNIEKLTGTIAGLKTQTTILQSPIRALLDEGRELMQLAEQHDLPVLFHTSINPADRWAQAADCLAIAEAFPRVRFNLAHSLRMHAGCLKRAAQMPNVWVDCSAHLNHCWLARADSAAVAAKPDRVDADYLNPSAVLEAIFDLIGPRYLWGSDNPFMSWCDDNLRLLYTYREEAAALHALPQHVKKSMAHDAPIAWLYGNRSKRA